MNSERETSAVIPWGERWCFSKVSEESKVWNSRGIGRPFETVENRQLTSPRGQAGISSLHLPVERLLQTWSSPAFLRARLCGTQLLVSLCLEKMVFCSGSCGRWIMKTMECVWGLQTLLGQILRPLSNTSLCAIYSCLPLHTDLMVKSAGTCMDLRLSHLKFSIVVPQSVFSLCEISLFCPAFFPLWPILCPLKKSFRCFLTYSPNHITPSSNLYSRLSDWPPGRPHGSLFWTPACRMFMVQMFLMCLYCQNTHRLRSLGTLSIGEAPHPQMLVAIKELCGRAVNRACFTSHGTFS